MIDFIQKLLSGQLSLEAFWKTEKERLTYMLLNRLPLESILKIKEKLRGNVVNLSHKVIGFIVHINSNIPIPNLEIELWDRDIFGLKNYLGNGITDRDGFFQIYYDPKSAGFGDLPDLELRVFDPDQNIFIDEVVTKRKNLIDVIKGDNNVSADEYNFGIIQISYYEYDPEYNNLFPYCLPSSIRHDFVPAALAITMGAVAKFGEKLDTIIQNNIIFPDALSYDEIQDTFPETLTTRLEKEGLVDTRSDDFFGQRFLNGFNPVIFKKDKANHSCYTTAFNSDQFTLTGKIDLPNYLVKFELKEGHILPIEITLQFRKENGLQPNSPLDKPQTYTPLDGNKWLQAKRTVRATHLGVLGEVKGHLSQSHFNMEQYAIALFRNVRKNPLRNLLLPHVKEVVHINNFGRRILMDPHEGFFARLEPIVINPDLLKWVRSNIGNYDWMDWKPRQPLCESHTFAKIGNLYWNILTNYVDSYFALNSEEIVKNWDEILEFSNELVKHSVPYTQLTMEQVDDDTEWYDLNEISSPRKVIDGEEEKAVRPITLSSSPTAQDLDNLKQVSRYVIYQCTFWHSWIHNEHNPEFGELKYGGLLRNGSMGDEDDESVLPSREVASIILAVTHMLDNFNYGFMIKNEDGDIMPDLIQLLDQNKAAFDNLGFDLNTLRSRLNS